MAPLPLQVEAEHVAAASGVSGMVPSGSRKIRLTRCSVNASRLPVRSRNGTSRHRSLSIHIRAAT